MQSITGLIHWGEVIEEGIENWCHAVTNASIKMVIMSTNSETCSYDMYSIKFCSMFLCHLLAKTEINFCTAFILYEGIRLFES